jgi:hypothetical protein
MTLSLANGDAEKAVLGSILLDNSTYYECPDLTAN